MMFYLGLVAFDHVQHRVWVIRNVFTDGKGSLRQKYNAAVREIRRTRRKLESPLPRQRRIRPRRPLRIESNFTKARYMAAVRKAKIHPRRRHFSGRFQPALLRADRCRSLRNLPCPARREPVAVSLLLEIDYVSVVASSPEMLVKVQGRNAHYRPIAGTVPRGRNEAEDRALEAKLLADPKERAEHIMLVDLGRNDLGRVCEYGSVAVERLMFVERYSHVMHLVSSLRGQLRADVNCLDALMACFPAGTFPARPKFAPCKLLTNSNPPAGASTLAQSSTWIFPAI